MDHFHSKSKGCEIKTYYKKKNFNFYYDHTKCLTHNKKICRCGFEFGWHNGEESCKIWKMKCQKFDEVSGCDIIK